MQRHPELAGGTHASSYREAPSRLRSRRERCPTHRLEAGRVGGHPVSRGGILLRRSPGRRCLLLSGRSTPLLRRSPLPGHDSWRMAVRPCARSCGVPALALWPVSLECPSSFCDRVPRAVVLAVRKRAAQHHDLARGSRGPIPQRSPGPRGLKNEGADCAGVAPSTADLGVGGVRIPQQAYTRELALERKMKPGQRVRPTPSQAAA